MTGQIPDSVLYKDDVFALLRRQGEGLPTPEEFGLEPFGSCTACWRGYVLTFEIVGEELLLEALEVNTRESPPTINGVEAGPGERFFKYSYRGLGLKTRFTGHLMIGKDFMRKYYVHMGFQRPMGYRTVYEFDVNEGDITAVRDLSPKMAEQRERGPSRGAGPGKGQSVEGWIEKTFSLDYDEDSGEE